MFGGFDFGVGTMIPCFQSSGKSFVAKEELKIIERGLARMSAKTLYTLEGIPSVPQALRSETLDSCRCTSHSVTWRSQSMSVSSSNGSGVPLEKDWDKEAEIVSRRLEAVPNCFTSFEMQSSFLVSAPTSLQSP